jgi:hypothetical protein
MPFFGTWLEIITFGVKARACAASSSLSVVRNTCATAAEARTRSNVRCIMDLPFKSAIIFPGNLTEANRAGMTAHTLPPAANRACLASCCAANAVSVS